MAVPVAPTASFSLRQSWYRDSESHARIFPETITGDRVLLTTLKLTMLKLPALLYTVLYMPCAEGTMIQVLNGLSGRRSSTSGQEVQFSIRFKAGAPKARYYSMGTPLWNPPLA